MIETDKNYWLYIAPHTYCHIKNGQALLYNTQSGVSMETTDEKIILLLQSLHDRKNLGAISCNGAMLSQAPYAEFTTEFCQKEMGNTIDTSLLPEKPVQMMPMLNLQCDIDKLQQDSERNIGEDVLQYLLELNIYLHSSCNRQCKLCSAYSKQCLCCQIHPGQPSYLPLTHLENISRQIKHGTIGKLNLAGGTIFEYPYYQELATLLSDFKGQIHIWNHYKNFADCKTFNPDFFYDVVIPSPITDSLENCLLILNGLKVKYHFYITGTEEYEAAEEAIEKHGMKLYAIHPIYTGNNLSFFEEYIYTDREDILQSEISFNEIFAHQKMNTHFFGSLTILPDGSTYANVNAPVVGNIMNDSLLDIINKEMLTNTAWRKTREAAPCSDCLYQLMCPSPSNYEMAIGKANLCHVKKEILF